jgi:hypothetical protein
VTLKTPKFDCDIRCASLQSGRDETGNSNFPARTNRRSIPRVSLTASSSANLRIRSLCGAKAHSDFLPAFAAKALLVNNPSILINAVKIRNLRNAEPQERESIRRSAQIRTAECPRGRQGRGKYIKGHVLSVLLAITRGRLPRELILFISWFKDNKIESASSVRGAIC